MFIRILAHLPKRMLIVGWAICLSLALPCSTMAALKPIPETSKADIAKQYGAALARDQKAKEEAYNALCQGQLQAASAKLKEVGSTTKGKKVRDEDKHLGEQLAEMAWWLRNNQEYARAKETAQATLAALEKTRGKLTANEAGDVWLKAGDLARGILNDRALAKNYYQMAAGLKPNAKDIGARLAQIQGEEDREHRRNQTDAVLKQRSLIAPPKSKL